jgi:hypothetical protein
VSSTSPAGTDATRRRRRRNSRSAAAVAAVFATCAVAAAGAVVAAVDDGVVAFSTPGEQGATVAAIVAVNSVATKYKEKVEESKLMNIVMPHEVMPAIVVKSTPTHTDHEDV